MAASKFLLLLSICIISNNISGFDDCFEIMCIALCAQKVTSPLPATICLYLCSLFSSAAGHLALLR